MIKVLVIMGTRPEVIKVAPIVWELKKYPQKIKTKILVTGQHRELLDQMLEIFKIRPNYDLDIMSQAQTLDQISSRILEKIGQILDREKPDLILVEGDTTTVFISALAAFYRQIKVGHIEAGLRTYNKFEPFPEEINRRLTDSLTDFYFSPTRDAKQNLQNEGFSKNIFVTGNPVIDALFWILKKSKPKAEIFAKIDPEKKLIILTAHRRENLGPPLENICRAVKEIANKNSNVQIVYPMHPNPKVRVVVKKILGGDGRIILCEPLDYLSFVHLMNQSYIILTDSGGVQEEAPSLGKPVLILRNTTERPEGIKAGCSKLVGTNKYKIIELTQALLSSSRKYQKMAKVKNPYGDGHAARKIVNIILKNEKNL